jgi:hypothetical protein
VPKDGGAAVPASVWAPLLNVTMEEFPRQVDFDYGGTDRLLIAVVLRVIGDAGDRRSLTLVTERLERLTNRKSADFVVAQTVQQALAARTRLESRLDWDTERAETLLLENERERRIDKDLVAWVRGYYADQDHQGYLRLLVRHAQRPDASATLLSETLGELERRYGEAGAAALTDLLRNDAPKVRVEAALALLRLGHADVALPALRRVAGDVTIRKPTWLLRRDWPRSVAIAQLIESGDWDVARMRSQLMTPGEDGIVIERLDTALQEHDAPLTDVERRETYRRVLDGPRDGGMLVAMEALVALDDRPSYERMLAIVAEMSAPADSPAGERDPIGRWHRDRTLPDLRLSLGE